MQHEFEERLRYKKVSVKCGAYRKCWTSINYMKHLMAGKGLLWFEFFLPFVILLPLIRVLLFIDFSLYFHISMQNQLKLLQ